jgi:hypothetical protein
LTHTAALKRGCNETVAEPFGFVAGTARDRGSS